MEPTTVKTENPQEGRIIPHSYKYTYSNEERLELNTRLLNALDSIDTTEKEFESTKADHKAKVEAAEALVCMIRSNMRTGFEMRVAECRCIFRPKDKKKDFYLLNANNTNGPLVATEDMTKDDYQIELIQAEAKFDRREEIILWSAGEDQGVIVVGRIKNLWYHALRLKVGTTVLLERLDAMQKPVKKRWDAVNGAAIRATEWLESNLPKDAKGFKEPIAKAIEPHKEREE